MAATRARAELMLYQSKGRAYCGLNVMCAQLAASISCLAVAITDLAVLEKAGKQTCSAEGSRNPHQQPAKQTNKPGHHQAAH